MPPKKRRKPAAGGENEAPTKDVEMDTSDAPSPANSALTAKLLEQHRAALASLKSDISALTESGGPPSAELLLSSSLALSNLKSLQRRIALQVEAHADASRSRRQSVEERSLVLENLNYERNYLRGEIASIRGWRAGELETMAWKELGIDPEKLKEEGEEGGDDDGTGDSAMEDAGKARVSSPEEAIDAYLLGDAAAGTAKSHRDPSSRAAIVAKLQADLSARSSLVEQLSKSKLQLRELQRKRDELRGFLTQIPRKLADMDRAGESLNKFFGSGNVWKDALNAEVGTKEEKVQKANLLVNSPSGERTKRFRLAQSNLPPPLYALFVQLAGYLDAWATLDLVGGEGDEKTPALEGFVGGKGMDVVAVPPEEGEEGWRVVLSISPSSLLPSEVTSTLTKGVSRSPSVMIKIGFSFCKEEGMVYASANDLDEGLLDGLFPGDDGSVNPNLSLAITKLPEDDIDGEEAEGDEDSTSGPDGKPYYWCQVLSGLDFPPPSSTTEVSESDGGDEAPFQVQACTKAVFRQLLRRIRAQKTLSAILEYLGKRSQMQPLPIHPTMKPDDGSNPPPIKAKVHSFAEDAKSSDAVKRRYVVTIKRKSSTLKATVTIDPRHYPAEPPVWSLQNEDGSTGTLSSWGEERGNVASLQQNANSGNAPPLFDAALHRIECHVNQELDKFVRQDVETTFDWILIHQLSDVVACWDEVMSASEAGGKAKSGDEVLGAAGTVWRLRKGKDRRLLGFGARSPFSYYRNGL
ncbi:hypothetical protein ACHAXT_008596 [Thalassiosira profunda]